MMLFKTFALACILFTEGSVGSKSYKDYQVVRAFPRNVQEAVYLEGLDSHPSFSLWTDAKPGRSADIMVMPGFAEKLSYDLSIFNITHSTMIADIDQLMQLERKPSNDPLEQRSQMNHNMSWTEYHPLEDMYSYLDYLEAEYEFVTTEVIGKSYEGTDMRVVKVCRGGCSNKPAIWIDGGIHAREWISPATVTWMIKELVENDADHPDLTENMDWYILPSHNPDGYAYSRAEDRMWRKTRSDNQGCKGVDANRNWGFHWAEGGSSEDPCHGLYMGPQPFSEVENRNVRDYVLARKDRLVFYNTIHSYSQLVLLPWGYTNDLPEAYEDMMSLALSGTDALKAVHGKTYETGCIPCVLYIASGSSVDWAYGDAGIKYVISMELRDTGEYAFLLPPDQIIPTAEETWAFHQQVVRDLLQEINNTK